MTEGRDAAVRVAPLEGGAVWRVAFGASKGNVLDAALVAELSELFRRAGREPGLKAIVLEGQGGHFSFGASVQEHLPEHAAGMLRGFHEMLRLLLDSSVVTVAAIRGCCLGGGLELASACHRAYASPDAKLGQPEIALGVFAPVASLLLAERVGRPAAEDLCLSGRTLDGAEALSIGLLDGIADDPALPALAYVRERLLSHSASSLRFAVRAVRAGLVERFDREIGRLERLYLDELMASADAVEGIRAFLDKRKPQWRDA
jgi:cyclohexa-1,5-dienecarbonyl-CoA hydratase